MGIDILIEFPLTYETAAMDPQDFIEEVLVRRMRSAYIAAGADVSSTATALFSSIPKSVVL